MQFLKVQNLKSQAAAVVGCLGFTHGYFLGGGGAHGVEKAVSVHCAGAAEKWKKGDG